MPLLKTLSQLNDMQTLTVINHNTEGLPSHFKDFQSHHELTLADVRCLTETETHLNSVSFSEMVNLPGYHLYMKNRNNIQKAR